MYRIHSARPNSVSIQSRRSSERATSSGLRKTMIPETGRSNVRRQNDNVRHARGSFQTHGSEGWA